MKSLILALLMLIGCDGCNHQPPQVMEPHKLTSQEIACFIGCRGAGGEMLAVQDEACICRFKLIEVKPSSGTEPDAGQSDNVPTQRL